MDELLIRSDDAYLVEQARQGSDEARSRIAQKYHHPLVGFVLGRYGCPRADAEDIVQDVWMQVFSEIGKSADEGGYDPNKGNFYTFVVNRHAKYLILRHRDRDRRSLTSPIQLNDDTSRGFVRPEYADPASDPEFIFVQEEDSFARTSAFAECFRLTFRYGGYPHQVLAFGYSKLIYGDSTQRAAAQKSGLNGGWSRAVEGDPKRLDAEHGEDTLHDLLERFWRDYSRMSMLDSQSLSRLQACLDPTRNRLRLLVKEMTKDNKTFQQHHASLLNHRVGATCLRDYFGSRGVNAVPDWCNKVQNRVREALGIDQRPA